MLGVDYANQQNAKISNLSLAVNLYSSSYEKLYNADVIYDTVNSMDNQFKDLSTIMVCASGNENLNADVVYSFPAVSAHTISVGSINQSETRSYFSNYGLSLDFVAPGEDIILAQSNTTNSYRTSSGTSFSAPYISAAAALILTEHPEYDKNKVKNYLIGISKDIDNNGKDQYFGNGAPIFNNETEFDDTYFIENYDVTLPETTYTYDDEYKMVVPVLKNKNGEIINQSNYTVTRFNNKNAGTALLTITGKNNYYGTIIKTFTINKATLSGTIKLSQNSYTYDGTYKKPTVTITDNYNHTINPNNYDIIYYDNKNAGTATIKVVGKNNYNGELKTTFLINKIPINNAKVSLTATKFNYTGSKINPKVSININGVGVLTSNYNVSYSNNIKVGVGKVIITGKGNYTGTIIKTFTIIPKKPTVKKFILYNKKIKTYINKTSDSPNGYQIKYKKKGSSWKTKTIYKTTFKLKKLKRNKKYYIKIRSFKKVNHTTYYSNWSKKYSVKTLR